MGIEPTITITIKIYESEKFGSKLIYEQGLRYFLNKPRKVLERTKGNTNS